MGLLGPAHLEQPHGVIEAAKGDLTSVREKEILTLRQLADDVGDQDLVGLRQGGDAGGPGLAGGCFASGD